MHLLTKARNSTTAHLHVENNTLIEKKKNYASSHDARARTHTHTHTHTNLNIFTNERLRNETARQPTSVCIE